MQIQTANSSLNYKNGHYSLTLTDENCERIDPKLWDSYKDELVELNASGSKLKELPPLPPLHRTSSARPSRDKKGNLVYKYNYVGSNSSYDYDAIICIRKLDLSGTPIRKLPPLPHGLEVLRIENCQDLQGLPYLPKTLKELWMGGTNIKSLPKLPEGLTHLDVSECPLRMLPHLPQSLYYLSVSDCHKLILPRTVTEIPSSEDDDDIPHHDLFRFVDGDVVPVFEIWEPLKEYRERSNALWYTIQNTKRMKESLVAKVFHPSNVEKWLEIGGFDIIEMMF
jgi:Leucine-rich repeat (LRR) protein